MPAARFHHARKKEPGQMVGSCKVCADLRFKNIFRLIMYLAGNENACIINKDVRPAKLRLHLTCKIFQILFLSYIAACGYKLQFGKIILEFLPELLLILT